MSITLDLKRNLPHRIIIDDQAQLKTYECDGLTAYKQVPLVLVIPETVAQIEIVLQLCRKHKTKVVTRGAGTGLSGGATPLAGCLLLSLAKLNKILSVNPKERTAVVEPGVRNQAVSEAVSVHNLYYAPDPSSQIACTIGGNVAENSGGVHCLKYGLTVHNIKQIKLLTITGEMLTLNEHDDLGLLALFTGSEGLLGVIIEITLKLKQKPQTTKLIMASFKSVKQCAQAVSAIIKSGVIPAGLEMMDKLAISASENHVKAGYPIDAQALLLCECDGDEASVALELKTVQRVLTQHCATEIRFAQDEEERLKLWQGRKSAFPAVGTLSPDYYCLDGTIPKYKIAQVLQQIHQLSKQYGLPIANVFHAGDGNLHPLILYDADIKGEISKAEQLGELIMQLCLDVGGTITGEHGVGLEKINSMCSQFNQAELEQFHAVKQVFDPEGLLNPGKAIPTLHRCAEFGKMHVHNNKLPFSDIPRF